MSKKVNVWFVGAGPGHPGLMTVRGRDILSRADVVLYDRLVNPGILTWAPSWAKLIDSGKTPGGEQMEQQEIHRLLVRYARKGMRVVRLKGGDPFVFGRGGEEAEFLTKAKIAYEVVPGVTAGIAGPAFAGIPVTHRGVSTEVIFRIGARAERSVCGKTLVGYMAVEGLAEFLKRATELGFSKKTPAGLVGRGTCRGQRVVIGTVADLAAKSKQDGVTAPAVVVVGPVVALRKKLAWWEKRPLAGKRIVLTVSANLGKGWREVFEEQGAEVWELPMTRIQSVPPRMNTVTMIRAADWLVFTSAAGVRAFPRAVCDMRNIFGKKIAVVGHSTAEVLRSIGLRADWVGHGPGSQALAQSWPGKKTERVLRLTGNVEDGELRRGLQKKGVKVLSCVIYRNVGPNNVPRPVLRALRKEGADWVVFASGTAAERFRRLIPKWKKGKPKAAVIGPATAKEARRQGWKVAAESKEASVAGVLRAMLKAESNK